MILLAIFLVLIFGYSLVSARLERSIITPPILFTVAGMIACFLLPELSKHGIGIEVFLRVAEAGLVLLLFTDASRTDLKLLGHIRALPVRLLSTGMLLTILLGGVAALGIFPGLSVWEAGILAAILAPTDAGLGQVIVTSPRVPLNVREALNVEAGLNDGLSVPFMLFFVALATPMGQAHEAHFSKLVLEQLGYGVIVGAVIGLAGGGLLGYARRRQTIAEPIVQLGVVTLPLLCGVASEATAASMFIASFVAGMLAQIGFKEVGKHSVVFTENWGQFINLSVFFLFGMFVARDWEFFKPAHFAYAILSLTVVRMLPVALALIGTKLSLPSMVFMGWFGPRGLASIVLGLVYLEHVQVTAAKSTIALTVMATVLLSIFAHGLSAQPGISLYLKQLARLGDAAHENLELKKELANPEF